MARYLLAASPLPGHALPIVEIGADLVRRGHQVTLLTGAEFGAAADRAGVALVPLEQSARPQLSPHRRSPTFGLLGQLRRGRTEVRSVFITPLLAQYRALCNQLHRHEVDAIVVDIAFTGALPLLCSDRQRPPVVVCGVSPLALSSVDTAPFGTGRHPRLDVDHTPMNRFVHQVLFGDVQARLDRTLRAAGANPCPVFLTDWPRLADRLLQLTVPAFEYPRRDLPGSVLFTGPVLPVPVDDPQSVRTLTEQLDTSATVIHVTQGTWDNTDPHQLIEPTMQAFADRDDVVVVVSTGGIPLPRDIVIPANAHVYDFVPYSWLLPRVDLMITNGGYGGVQHALSCGVPLVVAGRTADKPEVAARVAYTGVGIDLGTAYPSPLAVAAAARSVLGSEHFRLAAQLMAAAMAETAALDTIADVLTQLEDTAGREPAE